MSVIRIKDKSFKAYIKHDEIHAGIKKMATLINSEYQDKNPLFLAILNGAFIFAADLFKELTIDCSISFVKLASYKGTTSTGQVISLIGMEENISGRHLVILEDIIDSGKTLSHLIPSLQQQSPASVKTAVLMVKPTALIEKVVVDFSAFEIPDHFIVGYGMDYDGLGRNLKDIYVIQD